MMANSRRARYAAEYALARGLLSISDAIPMSCARRIGRGLGRFFFAVERHRRHVAIDNILRTQVAGSRDEATAIARRSFEHFGEILVEALRTDQCFDPDQPGDWIIDAVHPQTRELLDNPDQGFILASGHIGNWESAAQIVSCWKPVSAIAGKIKNPHMERFLKSRRPRQNLTLLPKRGTDLGRFLNVLKRREILALLIDQYGRARGSMVDFFGIPARTHASPAMLHLITRAPICFGACLREPDGRFRLFAPAPIRHEPTGDRTADVNAILLTLNHHLEAVIREYPDQYLWAHRRWRE